ncbi:transglycosylase domain-containing protein [Pseudovibrio brasiliensis]|uniref:peptidoglycan glycosyltransferase n=1 Tax=Pseudovibrio brasiliensis TaxID=1898042 RepID=A0ABX8ARE1_9HYPH|nr:PBP1A family penicillin-binding protein [Pseudovibrio brasiliensis]QUS57237.1 PBP1A family penicillin-binding protein [Pseudovibrio brasiliensis]
MEENSDNSEKQNVTENSAEKVKKKGKERSFTLQDLSQRMLATDAWLDSALWHTSQFLGVFFREYSAFMRRFSLRGPAKYIAGLASEGLTYCAFGFLIVLTFAQPAFKATERSDWKTTSDFSVSFFDRFGNPIGKRGILLNDKIPLDEIPDHVIQATLATEDRRFFDHMGIDFVGTFRAMVANVKARSVVQGGSSITQQLAKNLFLSNERTLQRKIKEAYLALWLEMNLTKREILKLYLDRAYMGAGTFGVAAASEFYFGKDVREISLAEAAMLAGLYKAPSKYAPHKNLPSARARANEVLTNIVQAGFMTEGQVIGARRNPAEPVDRTKSQAPDHFLDWAFEEVKNLAAQYPELSNDRVISVRTTLDPGFQQEAVNQIESTLRQYGDRYGVEEAAMTVITTEGAVRSMVGGRDYDESQFNRATDALRQPGSSFKPFVYMTAFMNGYESESVVPDRPISIGGWSPRNYTRGYAGPVTLKTALTKSINTIPVRLAQAIGRDKIATTAYMMGINSELKITRAMPLGVSEVTVLDMVSSYASFGAGGKKVDPYTVLELRDSKGELLYSHERDAGPPLRILPFEKVAMMNDILVNVVERGTGRRAQLEGITAAGKTGTTQAYRDAWFVGYTGNLAAAVWYGNDDFSSTRRMTGGSLPAMTWGNFMKYAHQGLELKAMPGVEPPEGKGIIAANGLSDVEVTGPPELLNRTSQQVLEALGERLRSLPFNSISQSNVQAQLGSGAQADVTYTR